MPLLRSLCFLLLTLLSYNGYSDRQPNAQDVSSTPAQQNTSPQTSAISQESLIDSKSSQTSDDVAATKDDKPYWLYLLLLLLTAGYIWKNR